MSQPDTNPAHRGAEYILADYDVTLPNARALKEGNGINFIDDPDGHTLEIEIAAGETTNDVLTWNGTKWVSAVASGGSPSAGPMPQGFISVPLLGGSQDMTISYDGQFIYACGTLVSNSHGTIAKIKVSDGTTVATVDLGAGVGPQGVAISPDDLSIYCIDGVAGVKWFKIATSNMSITHTSTLAVPAGNLSAQQFDLSPDGTKYVYVSNADTNLHILDTTTYVVTTQAMTHSAGNLTAVCFNAGSNTDVYVAHAGSSLIDLYVIGGAYVSTLDTTAGGVGGVGQSIYSMRGGLNGSLFIANLQNPGYEFISVFSGTPTRHPLLAGNIYLSVNNNSEVATCDGSDVCLLSAGSGAGYYVCWSFVPALQPLKVPFFIEAVPGLDLGSPAAIWAPDQSSRAYIAGSCSQLAIYSVVVGGDGSDAPGAENNQKFSDGKGNWSVKQAVSVGVNNQTPVTSGLVTVQVPTQIVPANGMTPSIPYPFSFSVGTPFEFSSSGTGPFGACAGDDGNFYVTTQGSKLNKFDCSGNLLATYALTHGATGIVCDGQGNIWGAAGAYIVKVAESDGTETDYALAAGTNALMICKGPDGNFWFNDRQQDTIGKITPTGTVTQYPCTAGSSPSFGICAAPNGKIYFTQNGSVKTIASINTDGTGYTEYSIGSVDGAICVSPDNNLWAIGWGGSALKKIALDGTVLATYTVGNLSRFMCFAPDGALYVTSGQQSVKRVTTGGIVTSFNVPTDCQTYGICVMPNGNLAVGENDTNQIAIVPLVKNIGSVNPSAPRALIIQGAGHTNITAPASLKVSGDITVEAWIQPLKQENASKTIIGCTDGTGEYYRLYTVAGTSAYESQPAFERYTSGGVAVITLNDGTTNNGVSAGTWCHIAATQSGTACTLYLNGVVIATGTASGTPGASGTVKFSIGENGTSNPFYGRIKNVAIYNVARTQAQIINDMTSPTVNANLVGYWPCAGVAGATTLIDTVSGNNLTCSGGPLQDGGVPSGPPT